MHKKEILFILIAFSLLYIYQPAVGNFDNRVSGLKNNTNLIQRSSDSSDSMLPVIISAVTAAGGIATIIIGLRTYRTQSKESLISRRKDIQKDIIFPLIKEFDESKDMQYAKDILDEGDLKPKEDWKGKFGDYNKYNLSTILRDHEPDAITDPGEADIRHSFDVLLDFLWKLEFLRDIELINDKEIAYFKYYIKRVYKEEAIMRYIKIYEFPLHVDSLLHEKNDVVG